MGDHFMLLVDRLITESTLEAAIESRNRLFQATTSAVDDVEVEKSSFKVVDFEDISTPRKVVECRICQDEDFDSCMETPCSCSGSLKYAHRRCIQRWCNEKGNTTCEICQQQFKPGYTAPQPLFQLGRIPANFRGNWGISRREHGPRIIAVVSTDSNLLNRENEDYLASTTRSFICCLSLALIVNSVTSINRSQSRRSIVISLVLCCWQLMVLLILRHTLPLVLNRHKELSFPLVMLILLRTAGIILPLYMIVKAITYLQRRCFQEEPQNASFDELTEEAEEPDIEAEPHMINVH